MAFYRSPLLQFAAIGLVLFGLWHWQNRDAVGEEIRISAAQIEQIASTYERTFLRPPEPEELRELIKDEIRDELAYREAKRLGLVSNDIIVKRRMRQKIEFLAKELSDAESISETELSEFYEAHKDSYQREAELEFMHLFSDPARQLENTEQRISDLKQALVDGKDPARLGDPTLLARWQKMAPISKIEATFGGTFAESLLDHNDESWFGPVESAFGLHLVRILKRNEPDVPDLTEIGDLLMNDLQAAKRKEALELLYLKLQRSYPVTIDHQNSEKQMNR